MALLACDVTERDQPLIHFYNQIYLEAAVSPAKMPATAFSTTVLQPDNTIAVNDVHIQFHRYGSGIIRGFGLYSCGISPGHCEFRVNEELIEAIISLTVIHWLLNR